MRRRSQLFTGVVVLLLAMCPSARASFHLWEIVEVYSNPSGTVQFIEMKTSSGGQTLLQSAAANISSAGHTYNFNHDLTGDTTNKTMLLTSPGYDALSGVPAGDYHLGVNNFFSINGDTINFDGFNTFTFGNGQLPTNGQSLNRPVGGGPMTSATNSPTNYAGVSGTIPVPEPTSAMMLLISALLLARRRTMIPVCR